MRNPDKTTQVVASRTSSFIPANIPHPPLSIEPARYVEEENLEEINQVIDNLLYELPKDSPPQFEDPIPDHIPATPIMFDHSPSPPLPNLESAPEPSAPETSVSEPSAKNPLDTHPVAKLIQETQPEVPLTIADQQPDNPVLKNQPQEVLTLADAQAHQQAEQHKHKRKRDKKKKDHQKESQSAMVHISQLGLTTVVNATKLKDGELGQLLETLAIEAKARSHTRRKEIDDTEKEQVKFLLKCGNLA